MSNLTAEQVERWERPAWRETARTGKARQELLAAMIGPIRHATPLTPRTLAALWRAVRAEQRR